MLIKYLTTINIFYRILLFMSTIIAVNFTYRGTGNLTSLPTLCPFRLLTGVPCPACGISRSVGALSAGDFSTSTSMHPLGILVALSISLVLIRPDWVIKLSEKFNLFFNQLNIIKKATLISVTLITLWLWNLLRLDLNLLN
jgi:hypothetical protein